MKKRSKKRVVLYILLSLLGIIAILIGGGLGLTLSLTHNIEDLEDLDATESALPTQIIDINGELITEFFPSEEKRNLVALDEVPDHLIHAILTREDRNFYKHKGFSLKRIIKAALDILKGDYSGGGSTITQQVAKKRYTDGSVNVKRKLVELWWATQLERRYTKDEILEFYINEMPFGHGTNGVEAASQFYFGHSAREITLAESVLMINALAGPTIYSPILNPQKAKERQIEILDQMVELGYVTQEERDASFNEYWDNYDYTRQPDMNVSSTTEDKAPWFSFYVQEKLNEMFLGSEAVFKGGMKVHTTLNLRHQEYAQKLMTTARNTIDAKYKDNTTERTEFAEANFTPVIEMLSLGFNIQDIRIADRKQKTYAKKLYEDSLNPVLDLLGMSFNNEDAARLARQSYKEKRKILSRTEVEGALVCLDSTRGYIVAMVGGGKPFSSRTNWFNRAVGAQVQPGSSFKPLYYSAAIKSRKYTPATVISDRPVVFFNDDGTTYTPLNYKGSWSPNGTVLLRNALAKSLNIPSLQVLEGIGFDAAIEQASKMLGITEAAEIARVFPRKFPLGLGIIAISPLQMARAYATFPNGGKEVTPLAIRYIEDRHGNIIREPEKELRARQKKMGKSIQLLTPQEAYIMVDMMQGTIRPGGTLYGATYWNTENHGFDFDIAGKTGTTQNWSDAWALGYTQNYTTVIWFGFDTPGNSLGLNQSGAVAAGPVWAKFMEEIHKNNKPPGFQRPTSGLIKIEICGRSGLLPDPHGNCEGSTYKQWFLEGTEPHQTCTVHRNEKEKNQDFIESLRDSLAVGLESSLDFDLEVSLEAEDPGLGEEGDDFTFTDFLDDADLKHDESEDINIFLQDLAEETPLTDVPVVEEPQDESAVDPLEFLLDEAEIISPEEPVPPPQPVSEPDEPPVPVPADGPEALSEEGDSPLGEVAGDNPLLN